MCSTKKGTYYTLGVPPMYLRFKNRGEKKVLSADILYSIISILCANIHIFFDSHKSMLE